MKTEKIIAKKVAVKKTTAATTAKRKVAQKKTANKKMAMRNTIRPAVPHTDDPRREFLRHTLATVAYRASKTMRDVPAGFAGFQAGSGVRTPGQILAHVSDLFDWALSIAKGQQTWRNSPSLPWDQEKERFFASLKKFDDFLASSAPVQAPLERLLQAPIADALTHVGQIAILRRLASAPLKGEDFFSAKIEAGRVGADQAKPTFEF
jgi:hypothetical protein